MTTDNIFRLTAAAILAAFYAIYFGKMAAQRRRRIRTDQIARGARKSKRVLATELAMKIATYTTVVVQIASIALGTTLDCLTLGIAGTLIGVAGVAVFWIAVRTMRDSWRAGIPEGDRTTLVTGGVFRVSRNPAFLAFDMVYVGVLALCFNPVLALFSAWSMVMLHLQIRQEETFLNAVFGAEYAAYTARVRRYVGIKRQL